MAIALVLDEEAFVEAITYARALSVPGGGVALLSGRDIYNSSCWMCHGPEGNGKGLLLRDNGAEARNFSSPEFAIDVPALSQMLSPEAENAFHGSRYMPGWTRRLTPHQLQDLVAFLRTFQKPGS
jgi:mono/diheme cytochrome c family protein